jgi:hypothetical protein
MSLWYIWRKPSTHLAPTLRLKTRFHRTHVNEDFHLVCLKWFLSLWYFQRKPCNYLALRLGLSTNGPKRVSLQPCHLGVPLDASKMISKSMVRLAQTVHYLAPTPHCLQMDRNKIPHDPRHLGVPTGASKMILEPMFSLTQTMHLSCVKISIISKWTKSTFGCVQNDFWADGTFIANRAHLSCTDTNSVYKWIKIEIPHDPRHRVLSGVSNMIFEPVVCLAQIVHISCIKISTISNRLKRASTWASSPRSTIGCVQNNF